MNIHMNIVIRDMRRRIFFSMSRRGEMRDAVSCALDSEKVTNITRSQSPDLHFHHRSGTGDQPGIEYIIGETVIAPWRRGRRIKDLDS